MGGAGCGARGAGWEVGEIRGASFGLVHGSGAAYPSQSNLYRAVETWHASLQALTQLSHPDTCDIFQSHPDTVSMKEGADAFTLPGPPLALSLIHI